MRHMSELINQNSYISNEYLLMNSPRVSRGNRVLTVEFL